MSSQPLIASYLLNHCPSFRAPSDYSSHSPFTCCVPYCIACLKDLTPFILSIPTSSEAYCVVEEILARYEPFILVSPHYTLDAKPWLRLYYLFDSTWSKEEDDNIPPLEDIPRNV